MLQHAALRGATEALRRFGIKESADVSALQEGLRRLNTIKIPSRLETPFAKDVGGGAYVPQMRQQKTLSFLEGKTPRSFGNAEGRIFLPEGGSTRKLDAFKSLSGEGRRAVNVAAGLHEGFERGVTPTQSAPAHGHASPQVIINEHNLLSKMTGPGADEARNAFGSLRGNREYADLRNGLEQKYGPRAKQFMEQGAKIPSAMRKNYVRGTHQEASNTAYEDWGLPDAVAQLRGMSPAERQPHMQQLYAAGFPSGIQKRVQNEIKLAYLGKGFVDSAADTAKLVAFGQAPNAFVEGARTFSPGGALHWRNVLWPTMPGRPFMQAAGRAGTLLQAAALPSLMKQDAGEGKASKLLGGIGGLGGMMFGAHAGGALGTPIGLGVGRGLGHFVGRGLDHVLGTTPKPEF